MTVNKKCVTQRVQRTCKVPVLTSPCTQPCGTVAQDEPVCRPDPVERFCPNSCPEPEPVLPIVEDDDLCCGKATKTPSC